MLPTPSLLTMLFFFFNDTATTEIYTLSLHDALPISPPRAPAPSRAPAPRDPSRRSAAADPAHHGHAAGPGRAGRHAHRRALRHDPPPRRRTRRAPDPRGPRARQETRRRRRRGGLRGGPRPRDRRLPLRPSLSRAPSRRAAHAPSGRSPHP